MATIDGSSVTRYSDSPRSPTNSSEPAHGPPDTNVAPPGAQVVSRPAPLWSSGGIVPSAVSSPVTRGQP